MQRWLMEPDTKTEEVLRSGELPEAKFRVWFLMHHTEKREAALSDPGPYRAYSYAANSEKDFIVRHLASMQSEPTRLLQDAGLGSVSEAIIMFDEIIQPCGLDRRAGPKRPDGRFVESAKSFDRRIESEGFWLNMNTPASAAEILRLQMVAQRPIG